MKTIYIYPTSQNTYLKITRSEQSDDDGVANIGCLQHVTCPGVLNVKQDLKDIIEASSRSPLKYLPFAASGGSTKSHGGVGYVGYYTCSSVPEAIDLLGKAVADSGFILEL